MRSRKCLALLIFALASFLFVGTGCSAEEKTQVVSANDVSVEVPESWSVSSDDSGYSIVEPDDFEALILVGVYREPINAVAALPQAALNYWDESGFTFAGDPEPVDGYDRALVYQVALDDGVNPYGIARIALTGDKSVAVIAYCRTDDEAETSQIETMLDSFTINNEEEPRFFEFDNSGDEADRDSEDSIIGNEADTYPAGSYRIGDDLPAGEYKLTCESTHGYYCVYPDIEQDDILDNGNFDSVTYVKV